MSARSKKAQRSMKQRTSSPGAALATTDLERGVQLLQQSNFGEARKVFASAALASPTSAIPVNCLGIVARMERQFGDAMRYFRKAIELQPNFAEAYNNLGNAMRDCGQLDQARDCYRRAITLKPIFADAYNNLGVIYLSQSASTEAIRCFEAAIEQQPAYAEAHNNLANAFRERGELIDAVASFYTALQLKPNAPEIHSNLGNVLRELGRLADAKRHYEIAVQLNPNFAEAHGNLANVLIDLEQEDAAIDAYLRAQSLQPQSADQLVSLGNAFKLVGLVDKARQSFERALTLEPAKIAHSLRVSGLCPAIFLSQHEIDSERARALSEWPQLADAMPKQGRTTLESNLIEPSFHWQFLDGNIRPLKEAYAGIFAGDRFDAQWNWSNARPRIGLVVARGHEGLFVRSMRGVLERLDAHAFELVVVCAANCEGLLRQGIKRDLQLMTFPDSPVPAAKAIREGRFDVLYYWEVGTDVVSYFLPFLRPAPVQCTSWGIQVTSGNPTIDVYLSNMLVEPADAQDHYTESLWLAPTFLTYQFLPPQREKRRARESFGISADQHLYLCAQQPGKFHPDFDPILAGILSRDPRAVIVGGGDRYGHATRQLMQRLELTIPEANRRIQFLPRLNYLDYLDLLATADVLLDPPHFGGVNSTYDGLALGKPIVTLPAAYHRGRYTAGCFRKMGVEDCVVSSSSEYIERAVQLATEPDFLTAVSRRIQEASSVLFHDVKAVKAHQQMFEELIQISRDRRSKVA